MADPPPIHYTLVDRDHVAFQVVGDGPFDLVYSPFYFSNLDVLWEMPEVVVVLRRLASFSRLILFDRRGSGLSERLGPDQAPTLEMGAEDHLAVMDAVGSERAAIVASGASGQLGLYVGATHPERTSALALNNVIARMRRADDFQIGAPDRLIEDYYRRVDDAWGTDGLPNGPASWAKLSRNAMSPRAARALHVVMGQSDLRGVLPSVRVPTLVVQGDETMMRREHGRYIADQIPGARHVQVPGGGHFFPEPAAIAAPNPALDAVQEFLTGSRETLDADRVLATVVFTDIVESTSRTAAVGDRAWRDLLDAHDAGIRREIARSGGQEINTTGDGFVTMFDGVVRAIECAAAMVRTARAIGVELRVGVHTGECHRRGADISGMAVVIASRVQARAAPGQVLVSQTVKDLVLGSRLELVDEGIHALKGVPGEWRLYALAHEAKK
jgi:class 3 adenylate cyclase